MILVTITRTWQRGLPLVLLLLFPAAGLLHAQRDGYDAERLTIRDGLSQNYVYCILQDHAGFMWFGTRNGLNRYDGYAFRTWYHEPFDAGTLSHNLVMALAEDEEGNLWIGTHGGGVNRLDRRRERFFCFRHDPNNPRSLSHDMINSLAIDGRGRLWIGTWGGGLCMIDTRAVNRAMARGETPSRDLQCYRNNPADAQSLGSNSVAGIALGIGGVIWLRLTRGLDCFDPDRTAWRHFEFDPFTRALRQVNRHSRPEGSRYHLAITADRSGSVFVRDVGTSCVLPDGRIIRIDTIMTNGGPLACEASGSILWGEKALQRFWVDGRSERIPIDEAGPPRDDYSIMSLLPDRRGTIWLGTDEGIIRLTPKRRGIRYDPIRDTSGNPLPVRAILQDADGVVWLAVKGGVRQYQPPALRSATAASIRYPASPNNGERLAYTLCGGNMGRMLCGNGYGVLRVGRDLRDARRIGYRQTGSFVPIINAGSMRCYFLSRDRDGRIWCCGTRLDRGLVAVLDTSRWIFDNDGMVQRRVGERSGSGVWCMMEDARGRLWFGTTRGVVRFDPRDSSFRQYDHDPSDSRTLAHNEVWSMLEDRRGAIWIGTMGGGLDRFDEQRDRFVHYTVRNGLAGNVVKNLLEDAHGGLWIGTDDGLSHLDPATGRIRNYQTGDMRKAGAFCPNTACALRDGSFLYGMDNGVLHVYPDSVRNDSAAAPLVFTRFLVQGRSRAADLFDGDTIVVEPSERYLSFEFASLDYRNRAQLEYAYRLAGGNRDWIPLGHRHDCSFAELPPGTYELLIRGTNSDGVWNAQVLRATIIVLPPFYLRWWFVVPVALLLLLAAAGGMRWRVRSIRRRAEHDRRLVESELKALRLQMNPHFFFNALNAIQSYIAAKDERQANVFIVRFARLMRSILENSRSSTVTITEELGALTHYLELESMRFDHRFTFTIDVDSAIDTNRHIPSMLIQPYVENAVQHGLQPLASGGRLVIALRLEDDAIRCRIEDNGVGRARAAQETTQETAEGAAPRRSLGMRITRDRLDILNATRKRRMALTITDLHDEGGAPCGTRVEIVIPIE